MIFLYSAPNVAMETREATWCNNGLTAFAFQNSAFGILQFAFQLMLLFFINVRYIFSQVNPLTPNDHYNGRTAPLTAKRCILYIYSTNIGTEYFKHDIYSSFFFYSKCSLFHNSNIFGSCIIHILYTGCANI